MFRELAEAATTIETVLDQLEHLAYNPEKPYLDSTTTDFRRKLDTITNLACRLIKATTRLEDRVLD